jgi:hypothetical protein
VYNSPTVLLGVDPSEVYLMNDSDVPVSITTNCAPLYDPAPGENIGFATTGPVAINPSW